MTPESRTRLREMTKRDEGCRLLPYHDSAEKLTIGYGHNLDKPLTQRAVNVIPDDDLADAVDDVRRSISWSKNLDDIRFAVLVAMAFNLGIGGLLKFKKMLGAAAVRDFSLAADEMIASMWAGQVGKRANRLARLMRTGAWPPT